jgi:hypothetical protein
MITRHIVQGLIGALSVASFCTVAAFGQRQSLTPEEIAQAIEWGQSGRPEGYPLRSAFPGNKTPPGAVYRPYLRVALAARAAREEGRTFTADDVTPEMTASLIYFAIGEVGENPLPAAPLPADAPLAMRLITEHSDPLSSRRREVSAVWTRRDVSAFLQYGLRPKWSYMFGAFRLDDVRADTRVELYREFREGSHREVLTKPGLVTETDLASWR